MRSFIIWTILCCADGQCTAEMTFMAKFLISSKKGHVPEFIVLVLWDYLMQHLYNPSFLVQFRANSSFFNWLQSLPQLGHMNKEGEIKFSLAFAFLLERFSATFSFHLLSPLGSWRFRVSFQASLSVAIVSHDDTLMSRAFKSLLQTSLYLSLSHSTSSL